MAKKNEVVVAETANTEVAQGEVLAPEKAIPPASERKHRASFASDNRKGGYMIRVEGPNATAFANRKVPVTRFDGTETVEETKGLIWSGMDKETGKPVALYKFVAHPRVKAATDEVSF